MKLTVGRISGLRLPPGKTDHIAFDEAVPGFGIRLREGGSRRFVFQYKVGDRQRRLTLGAVSAVPFEKARKTARNLYHRVKLGEDPASDKAEAKAKLAETLGATVRLYLVRQKSRLKPRSLVEVERHLLVHLKPLHSLPLATIERRTIANRLSDIEQASRNRTRNMPHATLHAMYAWPNPAGTDELKP